MALRIRHACVKGPVTEELMTWMRTVFEAELEPHFQAEEQLLLPPLRALGANELADRLEREHEELRSMIRTLSNTDQSKNFAAALQRHARFEERELFPVCEDQFDEATLDAIGDALAESQPGDGYPG